MEEYVVNWVVVSGVLIWTATFLSLRKLFPKRSFEFCNRLVSTIHALVAVRMASLSVQDWSCPVCPYASPSSPLQMKALAVTLSYLIYDLLCCLLSDKIGVDNTVHHIIGIVGIGAGLAYQKCGSEMAATMWITEISSPFLHLREIVKEVGYTDTTLNLTADILFAATFSIARMIGGPYLLYVTVTAPNPLLIKAMALGLQLVSGFWFYKIARMVRYKLLKKMTLTPTKVH